MQQCSDSHGHLTKWLLTATYWRLGLCPQNFTSTGHWIILGFNFIVKLLHFKWLQRHLPAKRKNFQKLSNVFKFQEHTQTNLYAKISALNILFSWKCWKTIASRSFWFHLQPGRYKLCTHKMDLNSAGFLFTHSWKYLFHTKNTRESPVVPQALSLFFSNNLKLYK